MHRTSIRLHDGRELIYFDEHPGADRAAADIRPAGTPPLASPMRYDRLTGEWIAMTAHRQHRTFLPPAGSCPLCPATPQFAGEIPAADYDVVVFENRFPAFSQRIGADLPGGSGLDAGFGPAPRLGRGRCEVVSFAADHTGSFGSLPAARIRMIIDVWADRTAALSALPGVEQVYCFENRGEAVGVTLHHPHGQIYGYPYVTPRTTRALDLAEAHAREHGGANLFGEVIAREVKEGERIVAENDTWLAFAPYAGRWPYEVHLYPKRQVPDLAALDPGERDDLADLYPRILRAFDALFDAATPTPYMAAWHQAPVRDRRDLAWLHLELFSPQRAAGKLKYLAASESGMGAFLNDVLPEQAAARLREIL